MNRKCFVVCLAVILLLGSFVPVNDIFAAVITLWRATNTTYVSYEHPDGYFSDTYYGVASVRGADRIKIGAKPYSFLWTQISFDVQGDIYRKRAYADSIYDTNQVKAYLTVKDKWNDGPKTEAHYDYERVLVLEDFGTRSVKDSDETIRVLGGGHLVENRITVEPGIVLEQGIDRK